MTRSIARATAGSIGFRNDAGHDAHEDRHRADRRDHDPLARARDRAGRGSFVRQRTVVHALEHPQHVDRRQNHAGRGDRGEVRARSTRAAEGADQDQELADEAVHAGQRDRRQRDEQERRDELRRDGLQAAVLRRSAACAGGRTACRR